MGVFSVEDVVAPVMEVTPGTGCCCFAVCSIFWGSWAVGAVLVQGVGGKLAAIEGVADPGAVALRLDGVGGERFSRDCEGGHEGQRDGGAARHVRLHEQCFELGRPSR